MRRQLKCTVCGKSITKMQEISNALRVESGDTVLCQDCKEKYQRSIDALKAYKPLNMFNRGSVWSVDGDKFDPQVLSLLTEAENQLKCEEMRDPIWREEEDPNYPVLEVHDGIDNKYYFFKSQFDNAVVRVTIGVFDKEKRIIDTNIPEYLSVGDLLSVKLIESDKYYRPKHTESEYGFMLLREMPDGYLKDHYYGPDLKYRVGEMMSVPERDHRRVDLQDVYFSFCGKLEQLYRFEEYIKNQIDGKGDNEHVYFVRGSGDVVTKESWHESSELLVMHRVTNQEIVEYFKVDADARKDLLGELEEPVWNKFVLRL